MPATQGLHHVTAIAGDPQENADFYVGTLGLRFLKRTVNHDDTGTYHFYFGDYRGTPGSNITFFPWTDRGRQGEFGAGQTRHTAYLVPPDSVEYWTERLADSDVDVERTERFGDTVLQFSDPDGIGLELVASDEAAESDAQTWDEGPVPTEHQLRGFHSVTLAVPEFEPTAEVLEEVFEYELVEEAGDRRRYRSARGGPGSVVDLVASDAGRGRMGVGTVHHVAFKAEDEDQQRDYRAAFQEQGLRVSEIIDRKYFQSIYAREPGGVLFEVATLGPGFTADEDVEDLGSSLVLPEWLEDERADIEAQLPEFEAPSVAGGE